MTYIVQVCYFVTAGTMLGYLLWRYLEVMDWDGRKTD